MKHQAWFDSDLNDIHDMLIAIEIQLCRIEERIKAFDEGEKW